MFSLIYNNNKFAFFTWQNTKNALKKSQNVRTKGAVNHPPTNMDGVRI